MAKAAELAGMHRQHWQMIESGTRYPTVLTLIKMSGALKLEVSELLE